MRHRATGLISQVSCIDNVRVEALRAFDLILLTTRRAQVTYIHHASLRAPAGLDVPGQTHHLKTNDIKLTLLQAQMSSSSQNAAIAATSAFLNSPTASSKLSASAAAAALRSQTTSPEPVANLQTKRMVKKTSYSSLASAADGRSSVEPHKLRRQSSSGSMTERTFRSPSPNRMGRSNTYTDSDAPPVPAVPTKVRHQRSGSLDRPLRIQSPVTVKNARAASVEPRRTSIDKSFMPVMPEEDEPEREPANRQTTNTTSTRSTSKVDANQPNGLPTTKLTSAAAPAEPVITGSISASAAAVLERDMAANAPKKKKKKKIAPESDPAQSTAVDTVAKQPPTPVNTNVNAIPKNPARVSPITPASPRTTRPTQTLVKQPSMVREEPEPETEEPPRPVSTVKTASTSISPPKSKTGVKKSKSITANATQASPPVTQRARKASLEVPGQHAHFATNPVDGSQQIIHEPSRSVSPAKSSLKQSPASSIRTSSPIANKEGSDTMSVTSKDGSVADKARRKKPRVSFEDHPSDPFVTDTQMQTPPASNSIRRSLTPTNENDDQAMTDRPVLPTFGSVRKSKDGTKGQETSKITAQQAASLQSSPQEMSSDQVVGALFAQKTNAHANSSAPLAPVLAPPSPAQMAELEATPVNARSAYTIAPAAAVAAIASPGTVPNINVFPATPGIEETAKSPLDSEVPVEAKAAATRAASENAETPQAEEAESEIPSPAATADDVQSKRLSTASTNSDTTDDGAAFSDAAEELDDTGGFASLDAIVESPVGVHTSRKATITTEEMAGTPTSPQDWHKMSAYWSSLTRAQREKLERQAAANDKSESDTDTLRPVVEPASTITEEVTKPKKKKKRVVNQSTASEPAADQQAAVKTDTRSKAPVKNVPNSSAEPRKSSMKKSMRDYTPPTAVNMKSSLRATSPASGATQLRSTMRSSSAQGMRSTLRDSQVPPARPASVIGMRNARPSSMQQAPSSSSILQSKKQRPMSDIMSMSSVPPAASKQHRKDGFMPGMTNDDSDSESSFRRQRRSSTGHTMKYSMRSASIDGRRTSPPRKANASSRWSVRSLSPVGNSGHATLRQSLRSGSVDPGPTMRGKHSRAKARDAKSPSRFSLSFGKGGASASNKPATTSRFADSDSDSDDGVAVHRPTFRSRLSDDSDAELDSPEMQTPATMRSVRSLPAKRTSRLKNFRGNGSDSDSDVATRRSRLGKSSMTSLRSNKKLPPPPKQAEIDSAMLAAQRNVANMLGKSDAGNPDDDKSLRGNAKRPTSIRADSDLQSPSPSTMGRRSSILGTIFGRKRSDSVSSVPRIALPSSPMSPPPPPVPSLPANALSSAPTVRKTKLQRKGAPGLQRLESGNTLVTTPGTPKGGSSLFSAGETSNTASPMRHWPLPPPKMPAAKAAHDRSTSLDETKTTTDLNSSDLAAADTGAAAASRPKKPERSISVIVPGAKDAAIKVPPIDTSFGNGKVVTLDDKVDKKKRFGKLRRAFGMDKHKEG